MSEKALSIISQEEDQLITLGLWFPSLLVRAPATVCGEALSR